MSDIDALRQRVEAAERSFGLIDERDRNYSARLINLISGIEGQLRQHQAELAERDARLGRQERENGELRAMLHSLLLAVEDGGKDRLGDTVNSMDQRISALMASEESQADPAIDVAEAVAAAETAAAGDVTMPEAGATAADVPSDETSAESDNVASASEEIAAAPGEVAVEPSEPSTTADAIAHDAAEPSPEPGSEDASTDTQEAAPEPAVATEAAGDGATDPETADPPPGPADTDTAEVSAADPAVEDLGTPEDTEDESLGDELLATLEDVIDEAPAEATSPDNAEAEVAENPVELDVEAAPDEVEAPPVDDIAALDEILSGDQTTDPATELEAEQPTVGALEGTDVVMVGWEADDAPDQAADAVDPELADRAEKIAALLSSGDESDPSVKEIIEKVTELAANLASEPGETAGNVDPTAETLVETSAIPDPAAEPAPQATSAA